MASRNVNLTASGGHANAGGGKVSLGPRTGPLDTFRGKPRGATPDLNATVSHHTGSQASAIEAGIRNVRNSSPK